MCYTFFFGSTCDTIWKSTNCNNNSNNNKTNKCRGHRCRCRNWFLHHFDFADRIGIVVVVMKLYGLYLLVAGNNDIVISCFLVFMTEVTTQMRTGNLLVVREWVLWSIRIRTFNWTNKQRYCAANVITDKNYNVRVILRLKWLK